MSENGVLPTDLEPLLEAVDVEMGGEFADCLEGVIKTALLEAFRQGINRGVYQQTYPPPKRMNW